MVNDALQNVTLPAVDSQYFIRCYGDEKVTLVDCRGLLPDDTRKTLGDFLLKFGCPRSPEDPVWKIKVIHIPIATQDYSEPCDL